MLTINIVPKGGFKQTYNHSHTNLSVHWVHENIAGVMRLVRIKGGLLKEAYNSSRQRIGAPMASQTRARSANPKPPPQK